MLALDDRKRATAAQSMQHPWVCFPKDSDGDVDTDCVKEQKDQEARAGNEEVLVNIDDEEEKKKKKKKKKRRKRKGKR